MQYNRGMSIEIRHSLWQIKNNASYSKIINTTSVYNNDAFCVLRHITDLEFDIKKKEKRKLYYGYKKLTAIEIFLLRFVARNHHAN